MADTADKTSFDSKTVSIDSRPLKILQIEDTPADAVLTAYALKDIPHTIVVLPDGEQALNFLHRIGNFATAARPDLILLDLSLPGLNGQEVLKLIKSDRGLKTIPVIIFSTLDTNESHSRALNSCANSYVVKPGDFATFMTTVQSIALYWSQTCRYNSHPGGSDSIAA